MKRFLIGALALVAASLLSGPAQAQGNSCSGGAIPGMVVGGTTSGGACYYIKVNSDGSINANATVTPGGTQDVNLTQVGGVTLLRGAGATGTGSERVTVAQDTTTIAGSAPGTAGAPSANVLSVQGVSGGTPLPQQVGITPTDRTITSATGSSQQVMSANSSRHSLIIQNTGNANCGINPTGGTAAIGGAGTLTLLPGGSYQPRVPTLSAVTAICTAAQPLYAEEN